MQNEHVPTVSGFGEEWSRFDNLALSDAERATIFEAYFSRFPWQALPDHARGFDAGCGSGRWAAVVAGRVAELHCVDASEAALAVARRHLADRPNCYFHHASVSDLPFADESMDFGYSLGVLHHTPDPEEGLRSCVRGLRPGAPFLVYLYYRFDNRPAWFRALWGASDVTRRVISRLPSRLRFIVSDVVAGGVYWPLARAAALAERLQLPVGSIPLSYYRRRSFYVMRNDALDRFGTQLERRFTRVEIQAMLEAAGLERVSFNPGMPYWCALGYKRAS